MDVRTLFYSVQCSCHLLLWFCGDFSPLTAGPKFVRANVFALWMVLSWRKSRSPACPTSRSSSSRRCVRLGADGGPTFARGQMEEAGSHLRLCTPHPMLRSTRGSWSAQPTLAVCQCDRSADRRLIWICCTRMRRKENIYVNVFYESHIDALCPAHLCRTELHGQTECCLQGHSVLPVPLQS